MFGGKKSISDSVKFYSVYTRKSVRVPKKNVCVKSIRLKHGRGTRYQLVAKKGSQKLFKFCNEADAKKFKKCRSRKSSKKSRKSIKSRKSSKKSRKSIKSGKSHKAHSHRHSRGSLRKYGRKKTKKHSHKHKHKNSRKFKKSSRHKHKH